MAKISCFSTPEEVMMIPNRYDVYFMDMDSTNDATVLGKNRRLIDEGSQFVYMSINPNVAHIAAKVRSDYFITKPFDKEEIAEILNEIKKEIKEDSIIIKIPSGERRVRINNLNYINIVRRCLCYHLKDGAMFDGQTLRSSFEKAIDPLHKHKSFIFLAPSLLINLGEIKIINKDNIVFENDDVLYFPMKQYDNLRNAWINYNRIID
ncbi:MAG: hypothetical protein J6V44_07525 [Methanobrevibacter sp.]|nr:hypothetical protein [Methanobrevibacter sp.]